MTVSVVQVIQGTVQVSEAATVTSTLSNAIVAGDVVVALIATNVVASNHSMAGLGATWTRAAKDSNGLLDLWVGTGATTTGTVTATQTASVSGGAKYLNLWHVRGTTAMFVGGADNAVADTLVSTAMTAGPGQIFIGSGYSSDPEANTFVSPSPAAGWVNSGNLELSTGARYASRVYRIPAAPASHTFSTFRSGSTTHPIVRVVIGEVTARVNSIKNPSFETNITGWAGSTLTQSTTESFIGTKSLSSDAGANSRCMVYGATTGAVANADSIPVVTGQRITVSAYVKSAIAGNGYLKIHWFNAAGSWLSDVDGTMTAFPTSWERWSLTATAPANAKQYGVVLYRSSGYGLTYSDAWLAEESPTLNSYFDGDTAATAYSTSAWTGTAHASVSTQASTVQMVGTFNSANNLTTNPTVALGTTPIAGDVLILAAGQGTQTSLVADVTAVSGAGATWTKATFTPGDTYVFGSVWVGTGATTTGTITATAVADGNNRALQLYHVRGTSSSTVSVLHESNTSLAGAAVAGQAVIMVANSGTTGTEFTALDPLSGWATASEVIMTTSGRYLNGKYRFPTAAMKVAATSGREMFIITVGTSTLVERKNHIPRPSFEMGNTNAYGWNNITSQSAATDQKYSGNYAFKGTASGANAEVHGWPSDPGVTVAPGEVWTWSAWVRCNSARNAAAGMGYNGAGPAWYSTPIAVPANTWTRVTVTETVPAGKTSGRPYVRFTDSVNGDLVWFDAYMAEKSATATDYFDGNTPGTDTAFYFWNGTTNDSISTAYTATPPPSVTVTFESRESGAWVTRTGVPKVRVAGGWVTKRPKRWNGTAWVDLA